MTLAGVGQKTANVVLIEYMGENFMAVDTHVFRVSHRLGLMVQKRLLRQKRSLPKSLKQTSQSFIKLWFYLEDIYVKQKIQSAIDVFYSIL